MKHNQVKLRNLSFMHPIIFTFTSHLLLSMEVLLYSCCQVTIAVRLYKEYLKNLFTSKVESSK